MAAKEIDLVSTRTFLDFDALFIFIPEISSIHHPQAFIDRRSQIIEFLQLGRTVVVFLHPLLISTICCQFPILRYTQAPARKSSSRNKLSQDILVIRAERYAIFDIF